MPSNGFRIEEKQKQIFYGNEQNKIPIFHSSDYLKDFLCLEIKMGPHFKQFDWLKNSITNQRRESEKKRKHKI